MEVSVAVAHEAFQRIQGSLLAQRQELDASIKCVAANFDGVVLKALMILLIVIVFETGWVVLGSLESPLVSPPPLAPLLLNLRAVFRSRCDSLLL